MNIEDFNLFALCVDRWGNESQILMTIEELNELSVVLCHSLRKIKPYHRDHLIEEIADVKLMLDQLQFLFSIGNDELLNMRYTKIKRLKKLLKIEDETDSFLEKGDGSLFGIIKKKFSP